MNFDEVYKLTTPETDQLAIKDIVSRNISSGVYLEGLLTLLGEQKSNKIFQSWNWLFRDNAIPFALTGFGDFFFWSKQHESIFYIEVQRGKSSQVTNDISEFFDVFITLPNIMEKVLRQPHFEQVNKKLGALKYAQNYIAEPWEAMGGSGAIDTFNIVDSVVYNSLVAQFVHDKLDEMINAQQGTPADR